MKTAIAVTALLILAASPVLAASDWIMRESSGSVPETADRLVAAVEEAGARVFAKVDHAAGASSVGEDLEPTILVIFGNPQVGTAVIKADRRAALDLPMRVLIWEEDGVTRIGYEDPQDLKARYGIDGVDEFFTAMSKALEKLTTAAAR